MPRVVIVALSSALAALLIGIAIPSSANAGWEQGEFQSDGQPVTEHHCAPTSAGSHPAVILLHGAGPPGMGDSAFEDMCSELAEHGYFTEFIEYYSQGGPVTAADPAGVFRNFPLFAQEVESGIDALDKNPAVDPKRVGMMGFSLGAFLSLAIGAQSPGKVAAIVDYYGALMPDLEAEAKNLPPTLILHGASDTLVPAARAHELDEMLTRDNRPHEMHIYPGAPHAFNFLNPAEGRDAWDRSLRFLDENLKPGS